MKDCNVTGIRNTIFAIYDTLYDAEKKVADFIMAYPEKAIEMTVSELSFSSEASEATIIRFCKKCGCKGFHHLKIQMAKEMRDKEDENISNELDFDNVNQTLQNIMANKIEEIRQTFEGINGNELKKIIDIILNAKIVQFIGLGNNIPIILDATYKFSQIGIKAVTSPIWENQLAFLHTLEKEDVVIAISASGSSKSIITMSEVAKKRGATLIVITNHSKSPLANMSDYQFNTATREKLFFDEFSFTRLSAMAVIEILFLMLMVKKRDSYSRISEHEQSMAEDKL